MKTSNKTKGILYLIIFICFILFCANFLLYCIELLTSKLN